MVPKMTLMVAKLSFNDMERVQPDACLVNQQ